jgi:hypothetical protein
VSLEDPANPSTLFQGPVLFTDPDRTPPVVNDPRYATYPSPFFSHMQVLVARTEFVADPEIGVPVAQREGTLSLAVGAVYALDWLTGAPVWRFPDRTYLPGGLRNQQIGTEIVGYRTNGSPITVAKYEVPGIVGRDKNLDGVIGDDEVFIAGHGGNREGGLSGAITFVPNVPVQGRVLVADVNAAGGPVVAPAPAGQYGGATPIAKAVAFFAADNGVVYAIDAYGNNDGRYQYIPVPDGSLDQRSFQPGSTNVLWTFSSRSQPRSRSESAQQYNRRLKAEVPATGAFGASSPVVVTATPENTDEQRLFVGNSNGVLYALTARAVAGTDGGGNPLPLPIRKGEQPDINDPRSGGATSRSCGGGSRPRGRSRLRRRCRRRSCTPRTGRPAATLW